MQNDNKNILKQECSSSKETTGKFSLNSFNNRLSIKFSSAATSSTSSTSTTGTQSLKIKKNAHAPFQFLRSKPPINPQNDLTANSTSKQPPVNELFSDAKQILENDDLIQNLKSNLSNVKQIDVTKSTSRLSYPFISITNENSQGQANNPDFGQTEATNGHVSTKTSAKRLLFNFISGNSNYSDSGSISKNHNQHLLKLQHVQMQGSQQRRLSDYHRPIKVSEALFIIFKFKFYRAFVCIV
jgi:hypothetical protein